jgi:tetratricopeptide (TPR) repeat protein
MRVVTVVAAVVLSATSALAGTISTAQQATRAVLVMPFDTTDAPASMSWLREGSAVLVADLLERYGVSPIARDERVSAFERLQLPSVAALSHATTIKIGQLLDADEVIVGSVQVTSDVLTVRVRVITVRAPAMTNEIVERGALTAIFGVYDRVVQRLRNATAPAPPPRPGTVLASHQPFEFYVKGLIAATPAAQRAFLEQALKAAPADDRVKLALWQVHAETGEFEQALNVVSGIPNTSLQARTARYLAARSLLEMKRYEEAFQTLKALQSEAPSAEVLNALGVVQLRRGSTPQTGRAVYYFNQASQADPTDSDYFFNLGYGYWLDGDPPAAVYWLREAVRLNAADANAHLVLSAALQRAGASVEAARERELAERLTGRTIPQGADAVPRRLERVKESLAPAGRRRLDRVIAAAGERDRQDLATHHLEAARRAVERGEDREAEQELRRALYLSPYLAPAHLLLGRLHLRNGRTADAIQVLKVALWSEESVDARLALAEAYLAARNVTAARAEVDRALKLDPTSEDARSLRAKIVP